MGCGHVGRVFVGVAPGWFAPDLTLPRAEEVVDHLPEASDLTGFEIIDSATKELRFMAEQLGGPRA